MGGTLVLPFGSIFLQRILTQRIQFVGFFIFLAFFCNGGDGVQMRSPKLPPPRPTGAAEVISGEIKIGNPAQVLTVAFVTSFTGLLVPGTTCDSSACLSHKRYDPDKSFTHEVKTEIGANGTPTPIHKKLGLGVGGSASGTISTDSVCVLSICVPKMEFMVMDQESDRPFQTLPFDGIFGLGLPDKEVGLQAPVMAFAEEMLLTNNRFAFWIRDTEDAHESEITLGSYKPKHLASRMYWINLLPQPAHVLGKQKWEVRLDNIVRGTTESLIDKGQPPMKLRFDSGTYESVLGGAELVGSINELLDIKPDCSNYGSLQTLGFVINGVTFNLMPTDYANLIGTTCTSSLSTIPVTQADANTVVVGLPFLRRFYTVYDVDALMMGIAVAQHDTNNANFAPVTLAPLLLVPPPSGDVVSAEEEVVAAEEGESSEEGAAAAASESNTEGAEAAAAGSEAAAAETDATSTAAAEETTATA